MFYDQLKFVFPEISSENMHVTVVTLVYTCTVNYIEKCWSVAIREILRQK